MGYVEESLRAKLFRVKNAQREIPDLKTLTKQFNLFKGERGVWCCGRRLANTEIPYAANYPILLPRSTSLIVKQVHERVCHNRVKETLAETRASTGYRMKGALLR